MSKKEKKDRVHLILKVLSEARIPLTQKDIVDKVLSYEELKVSRKTIQRDVLEMVKKGLIYSKSLAPVTFYSRPGDEFVLRLTNEEATYLIVIVPEEHDVNKRLKNMMGI